MSFKKIFFPRVKCLVCGNALKPDDNEFVCFDCEQKLEYNDKDNCPKCGRKTIDSKTCQLCKKHDYHFDLAYSVYKYDGNIRELIHKFKFENLKSLKEYFAEKMYELFLQKSIVADCIVYVPMMFARIFKRGYNQGYILCKYFSRLSGIPTLKAIKKISRTKCQAKLSASQRMTNVVNAFCVNDKVDINGKNILLIDDVLTTGGTADEISKILKNVGAKSVNVLTVASTEEKING